MTKYDPNVIQQFADRLYDKAAGIVFICALVGFAIGAYIGFQLVSAYGELTPTKFAVIGAAGLVGAFLGYLLGVERAFWLKLKAQTALCQLRIEWNTRTAAKSLSAQAPLGGFPDITA